MSIKLTAAGDDCAITSGFSPNGTYFAFGTWIHLHNTTASNGILGLSNAAADDYAFVSQNGSNVALDYTGGVLNILAHTANTWYWAYARNDGTDFVGGIATATGAYSTAAVGSSMPITLPTQWGYGCYGGENGGKDLCIQNGIFWSGASAAAIPTVAELQAQRTRLRPLPMVGGGSTLLLPYAWWPTRGVAELGDLSGGGQTLVGTGLELGDSPPVPWGASPYTINAAQTGLVGYSFPAIYM